MNLTGETVLVAEAGARRKDKTNMTTQLISAAPVGGNLHVGLAAIGAAIGVGLIGTAASLAVGRNPGAAPKVLVQSILSIAFVEAIVFYALFLVK